MMNPNDLNHKRKSHILKIVHNRRHFFRIFLHKSVYIQRATSVKVKAIVQMCGIFGVRYRLFREIGPYLGETSVFSATHKRGIIPGRSPSRARNRWIMSRRSRARIPPRRGRRWITSCMSMRGKQGEPVACVTHIWYVRYRLCDEIARSNARHQIAIIYGKILTG